MRYLCIYLIIILAHQAIGQPFGNSSGNYQVYKLEYTNSSGEKGTTLFAHNAKGILYQSYWSLDNKSRSSENYYESDEHGNIISAWRKFSDGKTSQEFFLYDSLGNKIHEDFFRSDSVFGFADYIYDAGLLKTAHLNNYKGWLSGTLQFTYNNNRQPARAELKQGNKTLAQVSYQYDSLHNLEIENWDFSGKWQQTFHYYYTSIDTEKNYYTSPYLVNGLIPQRVSRETYSFNNEIGGPSSYVYNAQGELERKIFTRSDSLQTVTNYFYDADHMLTKSVRNFDDGKQTTFTYTYNAANLLIARKAYQNKQLIAYEAHIYNQAGQLLQTQLSNFDGWLTGTITYESNFWGSPETGHFIDSQGFDADLKFAYNNNLQLVKLTWIFSFGKFQEYTFTYDETD